eukprot:Seg1694.2 transcript_id=Seg1694.2/GoldUCD/mRNA.D3Y31 product="U3 small nucleolar RNA-associated protein 18" protein_id=Seg1694.2/GoldUCD/D3Y31
MDSDASGLFFIDTKSKASPSNFHEPVEDTDSFQIITTGSETEEAKTFGSHAIKQKTRILGIDDEEEELEQLVFGAKAERLIEEEEEEEELGDQIQINKTDDVETWRDESRTLEKGKKRKVAWTDEDDKTLRIDIKDEKRLRKLRKTEDDADIDGSEYEKRLRDQFEKLVGVPEWAKLDRKTDESDDEDFFKSTRNYLAKSDRLPQTFIEIRRVKDANYSKYPNSSLRCLEFHPNSKIALTAGFNKTVDLFQIDNETNPKIQTIYIEGFPIYTAHFTPDGQQVILSSRRKYFYVFDITDGQVTKVPNIKGRAEKSMENFVISPDGSCIAFLGESGYINLVSIKTKQLISSMKMNGRVNCAAFTADGSRLLTFGGDGEVYIWDMNTKRCKHKFRDEGCLKGVCIDVSKDGRFVACGSSSGVVNLYDDRCFTEQNPKPIKTVLNLQTSIHCLKFNPSSEMLAISSRAVKDSLKLLHVESLTVFSNWPTRKGALGYVQSLAFTPQSGYLAVGNDSGKAMLFRLKHYPDG